MPGTFYIISTLLTLFATTVATVVVFMNNRASIISQNEKLASIYQKFAEGTVRDARTSVWVSVLPRYFQDKEYRETLIYYSKEREGAFIKKDFIRDKGKTYYNFSQYDISHLIDFYAYIYRLLHYGSIALEKACNQYFYHWWRGFLLSYALLSQKTWESRCINTEMKKRFPFHINLDMILKLDIEAMDCPFDPSTDIFYKKYEIDSDLFPGLNEHNFRLMQHHGKYLFMR